MTTSTLYQPTNYPQTLVNLLKNRYPNITQEAQQALYNIISIGYTVTEHGGYQQEFCQTAYQQLMNWDCQINANNLNQFAHLLADLISIAIENLRVINYGTLDSPFYRTPFFDAIKQALPKTPEAEGFLEDLYYQYGKGWKKRPTKLHSLAQQWLNL